MTCDEARAEFAASLLTRSEPPAEVAEHLQRCSGCRDSLENLVPVIPLLEIAPVPTASTASDLLLERVLGAAVAERRRRRWAVVVAAAAAVVLFTGIGIGTVRVLNDPAGGQVSATQSSVVASAALRPDSGGTAVEVTVSGLSRGTTCAVSAVTADGSRFSVVTWTVGYRGGGWVSGVVPVPPAEVVRVELADASNGQVLARLTPHVVSSTA